MKILLLSVRALIDGVDNAVEHVDSQRDCEEDEELPELFPLPPPPPVTLPLLLQLQTSPPDHMRDKAYVRTGRGFNTLTTSPLIHVHDADKRMLEFEFALIAGEKDAMPAVVATSFPNPSRDATVGAPNEFLA